MAVTAFFEDDRRDMFIERDGSLRARDKPVGGSVLFETRLKGEAGGDNHTGHYQPSERPDPRVRMMSVRLRPGDVVGGSFCPLFLHGWFRFPWFNQISRRGASQ